jgi:hypothetical protein
MRVVLEIPDGWSGRETADGWLYRPASGSVELLASRLIQRPPILSETWVERQLDNAAAAEGGELAITRRAAGDSASGWPRLWFCASLHGRAGEVLEHRVIAAYQFLYFFGTAEIRGPRPVEDAELLALIDSATPDLSGRLACLADLYRAPG